MAEYSVRVPDIGDFEDVEVIELLVAPGDRVEPETSLLTIESDKASMEIPAPLAGTVRALRVGLGDRVSEGAEIVVLDVEPEALAAVSDAAPAQTAHAAPAPAGSAAAQAVPAQTPAAAHARRGDAHAEVLVIGGGPGGYTAAFRAADLGRQVVLVERHSALGGVCLNVGCIPSKALLHVAEQIRGARELASVGVRTGEPRVDLDALRAHKSGIVEQLTGGLAQLAKRRGVRVITGVAVMAEAGLVEVEHRDGRLETLSYDDCVLAIGSRPVRIPGLPYDDPRVMDSSGALELEEIPGRLLVIGGGIIGLEMATVYAALGAQISVVEMLDSLVPGADPDLVRVLHKQLETHYENIWTGTRVAHVEALAEGIEVHFEGEKAPDPQLFDRVLVAVGRQPRGASIGADRAGVQVDERGFIPADERGRTNVEHVYAIGDVVGGPMLAHKASAEGRIAAETICGLPSAFDGRQIPSVAYTDPEIAWVGLTEVAAREAGTAIDKASFPWAASGRSLSLGRREGLTKLISEQGSGRLLGCGIVGPNASELIAEATHAIEMGSCVEDLALTIHPHPTLSETIGFAAEMIEGTVTDLYLPRKR